MNAMHQHMKSNPRDCRVVWRQDADNPDIFYPANYFTIGYMLTAREQVDLDTPFTRAEVEAAAEMWVRTGCGV